MHIFVLTATYELPVYAQVEKATYVTTLGFCSCAWPTGGARQAVARWSGMVQIFLAWGFCSCTVPARLHSDPGDACQTVAGWSGSVQIFWLWVFFNVPNPFTQILEALAKQWRNDPVRYRFFWLGGFVHVSVRLHSDPGGARQTVARWSGTVQIFWLWVFFHVPNPFTQIPEALAKQWRNDPIRYRFFWLGGFVHVPARLHLDPGGARQTVARWSGTVQIFWLGVFVYVWYLPAWRRWSNSGKVIRYGKDFSGLGGFVHVPARLYSVTGGALQTVKGWSGTVCGICGLCS